VRSRQRHAEFRGVLSQRAGLIAAELGVKGADADLLLAQVLGEDAADLAVADETDMPTV